MKFSAPGDEILRRLNFLVNSKFHRLLWMTSVIKTVYHIEHFV
jgi:hypothetical protein